jgi:uncharacterized membrane protein
MDRDKDTNEKAPVDRGSEPKDFFTAEEQQRITAAVAAAEKRTSGEIRVHLARKAGRDVYKAAVNVFERLGMHRTEQRNGVLIYLGLQAKKFAIIGDRGIHENVADDFWEETSRVMAAHFRRGDFAGGIVAGVNSAGEKLSAHFPWQEDDVNELSDEISMES